jgi:transposase
MPKHATATTRAYAMALREAGVTWKEIIAKTGMSNSSINRLFEKADALPTTAPPTIPGRKAGSGFHRRKATPRIKSIMKRMVEKNPMISARRMKETCPSLAGLAVRTIRDILNRELGLISRSAAKKPFLSEKMKEKRLAFAKKYRRWSVNRWKQVMFSDESNFEIFRTNKHARVRRPVGSDRFDARYTVKTVKHPEKVMVWGCFSHHGRGGLSFLPKGVMMNKEKYLETLTSHLIPFMARHKTTDFLQDGAPCHTAKIVTAFLAKKKLKVLDWPGNSPDLNPIENAWSYMKDKLEDKPTPNLAELVKQIKLLWCRDISTDYFQTLVRSMPARLEAVIAAGGGSTKY